MIHGKQVLVIIPARGGSKGLPRKNVLPVAGEPMIGRVIKEVLLSSLVDRIIVSTEDEEIKHVACEFGADVPFTRPLNLASDEATVDSVIEHTLQWLFDNEGYSPDIVALVQANSPFLTSSVVDNCISCLVDSDSEVVYTVSQIEHPPYWAQVIGENQIPTFLLPKELIPNGKRRQDMPMVYRPTGTVSVLCSSYYWRCKKNGVVPGFNLPIEGQRTQVVTVDQVTGLDIDSHNDYILSQMLINERN